MTPFDDALWTRPLEMPLEDACPLNTLVEDVRSSSVFSHALRSQSRQRGPVRLMSCVFQVIFFYNFIFKFYNIKEREWILAGAQWLLIYNIFNKIYINKTRFFIGILYLHCRAKNTTANQERAYKSSKAGQQPITEGLSNQSGRPTTNHRRPFKSIRPANNQSQKAFQIK